ncbi:MAG TPA: phosphate regulon transcriptional regulator PhoB [Usitatibacter sp.]|nr:phosphate regulon transcriptional regulator PhoB [Usitatibacter sp.]HUJ00476.1 phosphate regulon transcriptional regulator PhoB [Usitatibacter sp.]
MAASILVVEDEPAIQELISITLARHGHTVRRTANAKEAYEAVTMALPDVILLDWMLPDGSGPSLARRLRTEQRTREVPIIMLTARAAEDDKVAGLDSGVDDYVTKPFSPRELEARIQAVLRRRLPQLSKEAVEIEGLVLNPATRVVSGKGRTLKMGPTEFELLHFFMTHTDRVYTRAQILDQVWGDHVFLEDRTVDVHIRRLREALSPSGHDRLVETVRGAGYRFRSSD